MKFTCMNLACDGDTKSIRRLLCEACDPTPVRDVVAWNMRDPTFVLGVDREPRLARFVGRARQRADEDDDVGNGSGRQDVLRRRNRYRSPVMPKDWYRADADGGEHVRGKQREGDRVPLAVFEAVAAEIRSNRAFAYPVKPPHACSNCGEPGHNRRGCDLVRSKPADRGFQIERVGDTPELVERPEVSEPD